MRAEVTVLMALVMIPSGAAFSGSGSGTEADPFVVEDCSMLDEMRDDLDAYYLLGSDIDCSGNMFQPVDDFSGVLDGDGHIIHDLEINQPGSKHVGLIGHAVSGAEIKEVGLEKADVSGRQFVGSLVGELGDATVSRAYVVNSTVTGGSNSDEIGTLVGLMRGSTPFAHDLYSMDSDASGDSDVGGLIGQINDGEITRSYSVSSAQLGTNEGTEGVLLGKLFGGTVTSSYWQADVEPMKSDGGSEKVEDQLKQQSTYTGWDFNSVWRICPSGNSGYPFLRGIGDFTCHKPEISLYSPSDINTDPGNVDLSVYVEHEGDRDVNVTFYNSSDQVIGEEINVAPGQVVSVPWNDLDHESSYEWYVEVTDGVTEVDSDIKDFRTITVDFSWDDRTILEEGYRVFANDTGEFTEIRRTPQDTESVRVAPKGLDFGELYCFRSLAYNSAGQSGYTQDCVQP